MGRSWIDSLTGFDLSTVKLSDIGWQYGTGAAISSGNGRQKTYRYRNGVMTKLGDIAEHIWYSLAESIARRDGETWFVDALTTWEGEHNYIRSSSSELRRKALHLYSARIFDQPEWVAYIPFNRRFRPEVLDGAHIVTVINDCCNKPGEVTQEQINRAYGSAIACPHCGRWSHFSIVGDEQPPWEEF